MAKTGVKKGNRMKLSISIGEDNVNWVESQVETQKYRSVSHAIDAILREKRIGEST
jgi:Arc/MetJ-type ribon-helix-helix transcriptional regulator